MVLIATCSTGGEERAYKTSIVELGAFKMDEDGNSLGDSTEMDELLRQVVYNDTADLILIRFGWVDDSKELMPMRIEYSKPEKKITLVYERSVASESWGPVEDGCLIDMLQAGERSISSVTKYCAGAEYAYDAGSGVSAAAGEKPEQSEVTGAVQCVRDFVRSNANDASSIKFLEWSTLTPAGDYWIVRCKYKGSNAYGGIVTNENWFYIQNNQVVGVK